MSFAYMPGMPMPNTMMDAGGGGLPFMQMPQLSPNQLMAAQMGGGRGFTPATNPYAGMFPSGFMPNSEQTRTLGAFQQQMGGMGPMQGPNAKMGGPQATPMGDMGFGQRMSGQGVGMQPGANGPAGWMQPQSISLAGISPVGDWAPGRSAARPMGRTPQISSWSSQGQQAPSRLPFTPWRGPGMGTSGMGGT